MCESEKLRWVQKEQVSQVYVHVSYFVYESVCVCVLEGLCVSGFCMCMIVCVHGCVCGGTRRIVCMFQADGCIILVCMCSNVNVPLYDKIFRFCLFPFCCWEGKVEATLL